MRLSLLLFSISAGRSLITTPVIRASRAPAPRACASPARLFPQELNLIYDSKCGVCQWEVDFLRSRDSEGRLTYTDLESEDFEEGVPRNGYLTYEAALASFHAVRADGTLLKGMPVFQEAYAAVGLGWVWSVYNNPLAARFLDLGYSLFAHGAVAVACGVLQLLTTAMFGLVYWMNSELHPWVLRATPRPSIAA